MSEQTDKLKKVPRKDLIATIVLLVEDIKRLKKKEREDE